MKPITGAAIVLAALAGAVPAGADELTVRKLPPFRDVTITEVRGGQITFRLPNGVVNTQPADQVDSLALRGAAELNQAEALAAQGKPGEAIPTYDQAMAKARPDSWQARLIRYRRLATLSRAGRLDRATEDWLAVMDESAASPSAIAMRPEVAGQPQGMQGAVSLLEARLRQTPGGAYETAVKGLLLAIYENQGLKDKAGALAAELSGRPASPAEPGAADQLAALEVRLQQGQAAEALAEVRKNLGRYGPAHLPRALLLAGKAHRALAEGPEKRERLIEAGLHFMRVYAYFPQSAEAAEALYLAGEVNASLPKPNVAAAKAAYRKVMQAYPSSPFSGRAKESLERAGR